MAHAVSDKSEGDPLPQLVDGVLQRHHEELFARLEAWLCRVEASMEKRRIDLPLGPPPEMPEMDRAEDEVNSGELILPSKPERQESKQSKKDQQDPDLLTTVQVPLGLHSEFVVATPVLPWRLVASRISQPDAWRTLRHTPCLQNPFARPSTRTTMSSPRRRLFASSPTRRWSLQRWDRRLRLCGNGSLAVRHGPAL